MALLVFLLSLGAIAWLPGRALLALLRVRAGLLEQAVVSLALGLVGSAAAYWLLAFLGLRPLFWLWPPAAGLLLFRLREAGPRRAPEEGARGDLAAVGALVVLAVAALAFAPFYYRNLAPTRDGGLTFYALPDLVLHLSIAQELTHAVPPTVPFMPGTPLSYHYGADLVLALFSAVPGLGLPDVAARFVPTLFFALALGAAFVAARAFGLGRAGATAATRCPRPRPWQKRARPASAAKSSPRAGSIGFIMKSETTVGAWSIVTAHGSPGGAPRRSAGRNEKSSPKTTRKAQAVAPTRPRPKARAATKLAPRARAKKSVGTKRAARSGSPRPGTAAKSASTRSAP